MSRTASAAQLDDLMLDDVPACGSIDDRRSRCWSLVRDVVDAECFIREYARAKARLPKNMLAPTLNANIRGGGGAAATEKTFDDDNDEQFRKDAQQTWAQLILASGDTERALADVEDALGKARDRTSRDAASLEIDIGRGVESIHTKERLRAESVWKDVRRRGDHRIVAMVREVGLAVGTERAETVLKSTEGIGMSNAMLFSTEIAEIKDALVLTAYDEHPRPNLERFTEDLLHIEAELYLSCQALERRFASDVRAASARRAESKPRRRRR